MLKLSRIVEQYGTAGQYDLGRDFANFRRTIDGADDEIKRRFEQIINSKLAGKRIVARASRGYKQYIKEYEFDVVKITLDDYYDNYVVVAHDNTTPKSREYFLKSGYKIKILGPATGQPSPQKGGKPLNIQGQSQNPIKQPKQDAQSQPMTLAGNSIKEEEEENNKSEGYYDAYPVDSIIEDIKGWLPKLLKKPESPLRDFVKGLGWQKKIDENTTVAIFDLKIPSEVLKYNFSETLTDKSIEDKKRNDNKYNLIKLEPNKDKSEWVIRIKKVMMDDNI